MNCMIEIHQLITLMMVRILLDLRWAVTRPIMMDKINSRDRSTTCSKIQLPQILALIH
jgi:hypothetical protein